MYPRALILLAAFATVALPDISAQSSTEQELPSAPSAVSQQRQAEKKAASTAPAAKAPPATEPLPGTQSEADVAKSQTASSPKSPEVAPPPDQASTTFRRTVNEVNVAFTVTDKHGHYVNNLTKNDFSVLDDQKPALDVRSFHRETDLPLQVGLLVDASNSVRDRFKFEQEAAIEFLNQTIRPKYDQAFVVGFDVTPEVTQDFTDNTDLLSRGVRALRAGGGTAMYDALYFACRDKLLKAQQTGPLRKAIILLSDGDDNQSHVTREEAIEMAQRADVIVYTISTNVSGTPGPGDKVLDRIADATGGRVFLPFQLTDVANAFAQIQDELRSQYAISYKPADFVPDGRFRAIEILAKDKKLRVRSKHGYYAPVP